MKSCCANLYKTCLEQFECEMEKVILRQCRCAVSFFRGEKCCLPAGCSWNCVGLATHVKGWRKYTLKNTRCFVNMHQNYCARRSKLFNMYDICRLYEGVKEVRFYHQGLPSTICMRYLSDNVCRQFPPISNEAIAVHLSQRTGVTIKWLTNFALLSKHFHLVGHRWFERYSCSQVRWFPCSSTVQHSLQVLE